MNGKKKASENKPVFFEEEENANELLASFLDEKGVNLAEAEAFDDQPAKLTKKNKSPTEHTVDLHGLTLEAAKRHLNQTLRELLAQHGLIKVKIITGKGHHSADRDPVLSKEIHGFLSQSYKSNLVKIDHDPWETRIGGIPIKGHFHAVLVKR